MADRPWIDIDDFTRAEPAAVARLAAAGTSIAANLRPGSGGLAGDIVRICGSRRVAGPALTARAPAGDNLAAFLALRAARPGDVLVLATGTGAGCAVVGDRIAQMAVNGGIVAIVTDGLVRDIDALTAIGLPVYARGRSPNSPTRHGPVEIGRTIEIGGRTIAAGDIVIADADGIAAIDRGELEAALACLPAALEAEAAANAAAANARFPAWLEAEAERLADKRRPDEP